MEQGGVWGGEGGGGAHLNSMTPLSPLPGFATAHTQHTCCHALHTSGVCLLLTAFITLSHKAIMAMIITFYNHGSGL